VTRWSDQILVGEAGGWDDLGRRSDRATDERILKAVVSRSMIGAAALMEGAVDEDQRQSKKGTGI